jgi:hypothetical protein
MHLRHSHVSAAQLEDRTDFVDKDSDIGPFRVMHAPGHTPGSICMFSAVQKVLCVGDNCMLLRPICCGGGVGLQSPAPFSTPDLPEARATDLSTRICLS